jgi:hypothetical protein
VNGAEEPLECNGSDNLAGTIRLDYIIHIGHMTVCYINYSHTWDFCDMSSLKSRSEQGRRRMPLRPGADSCHTLDECAPPECNTYPASSLYTRHSDRSMYGILRNTTLLIFKRRTAVVNGATTQHLHALLAYSRHNRMIEKSIVSYYKYQLRYLYTTFLTMLLIPFDTFSPIALLRVEPSLMPNRDRDYFRKK